MVKTGRGGFTTLRSFATAAVGKTKQVEISALHELKARAHQADCSIPNVVRFPGPANWNARGAEQRTRNIPIRGGIEVAIERA